MKHLAQLTVTRKNLEPATIELLHGDLSAIPLEHAVDILIISAFEGDYYPSNGTLIGALKDKELFVTTLAADKEIDLRVDLGCWLSKDLTDEAANKFNFKRILCFEPRTLSNKPELVVKNVFKCLNYFLIPDLKATEANELRNKLTIKSVAMPVLATGDQQVPIQSMLPAILETAIFWLETGLPLSYLKIVVFNEKDIEESKRLFHQFIPGEKPLIENEEVTTKLIPTRAWKNKFADQIGELLEKRVIEYLIKDLYSAANEQEKEMLAGLINKLDDKPVLYQDKDLDALPLSETNFDVFVSYSHVHRSQVVEFVSAMKKEFPNLKIFFDGDSIPAGGYWIRKISESIASAKVFIALLSPEYNISEICWLEFQCAKLREVEIHKSIIKPILFYKSKHNLPLVMGVHSWLDCTEGDVHKLKDNIRLVLQ